MLEKRVLVVVGNINIPKYNYHSHTYRCGHADICSDEKYIMEAIRCGYQKYGITDHVPVHPIYFCDGNVRMHDKDRKEYIESIKFLKKKYKKDILVFSGYEAEYDEKIEKYLCELRDECDYMNLGQHYVLDKKIRSTPEYPIEYAKKVCRAIESGIFDIVVHPDIFMIFRFKMKTDDDKKKFLENALVASRMICEKAKEYSIPLEINLGTTKFIPKEKRNSKVLEENAKYPTKLFWDIASSVGNDVLVGIDAHSPFVIEDREKKVEVIGEYIALSKLQFLPISYDPVKARKNNKKLKSAYRKTKSQLTSVESRIIEEILDNNDFNKDDIVDLLKSQINLKSGFNECTVLALDTIKRREKLLRIVGDCIKKINQDDDKEKIKKLLRRNIN